MRFADIVNGKACVRHSQLPIKEVFGLILKGHSLEEISIIHNVDIVELNRLIAKIGEMFDKWKPKKG